MPATYLTCLDWLAGLGIGFLGALRDYYLEGDAILEAAFAAHSETVGNFAFALGVAGAP